MACQGSELIVGLGKMYCEKCGTGKFDMPEKLGNYYDITGTSMVFHNKVDFGKLLKQLEQEKLYLFNWDKTPIEERRNDKLSPPMHVFIGRHLENYEVGDNTPPFEEQILTQLKLDIWSLQMDNISKILAESYESGKKKDIDIIDENSEEYNDIIEQLQQLQKYDNGSMRNSLKVQSVIVNHSMDGI